MGNPVFIGKTPSPVSGRGTSISVGIPATTRTKDLLLLLCQTYNESIAAPSGWSEIGSQVNQAYASPATRLAVFYKFAQGSDSGSSVSVNATSDHTVAQVLVFRGVDRLGFASTDNYSSYSGITTIGSGSLNDPYVLDVNSNVIAKRTDCLSVVVGGISRRFNSTDNFDVPFNTNLTSLQELTDVSVNTGSGGGLFAWAGNNDELNQIGVTTAIYKPTNTTPPSYGSLVLNLRPTRNLTSFS